MQFSPRVILEKPKCGTNQELLQSFRVFSLGPLLTQKVMLKAQHGHCLDRRLVEEIVKLLADQMVSPVLWEQPLELNRKVGSSRLYEICVMSVGPCHTPAFLEASA